MSFQLPSDKETAKLGELYGAPMEREAQDSLFWMEQNFPWSNLLLSLAYTRSFRSSEMGFNKKGGSAFLRSILPDPISTSGKTTLDEDRGFPHRMKGACLLE